MAPTRSDAITTARQEELGWEAEQELLHPALRQSRLPRRRSRAPAPADALLDLLLVEPGSMVAGDLRAT